VIQSWLVRDMDTVNNISIRTLLSQQEKCKLEKLAKKEPCSWMGTKANESNQLQFTQQFLAKPRKKKGSTKKQT